MTVLLPSPVLQFCDAIGAPYAAGTIETYVTGTTTPKATWNDPAGGAGHLNTNPIVLDSAGRCILYGDGGTRLVLRDSAGNLIWDQPSTTLVSAAMLPVVQAATIADAVALLGIQGLIDASVAAEATLRAAGDATNAAAIAAETTRAEAAEAALGTRIDNETAARIAADTHLQSEIDTINATIAGLPTSSGGSLRAGGVNLVSAVLDVTFAPAFPTACMSVEVFPIDPVADPPYTLSLSPGGSLLNNTRVIGTVLDHVGTPISGGDVRFVAFGY